MKVSYKKCGGTLDVWSGVDLEDMSISNKLRGIVLASLYLLQACGGGGGGAGGTLGSSTVVKPIEVLPSSFENKALPGLPVELTQLPKLSVALGGVFTTGWDSVGDSLAVADFKRNATYSAFVIVSNQINSAKPYFVGYTPAGGYEIQDLFNDPSVDQVACPFPQQSLIADLNGDTRPDVYVACAGSNTGAPLPVEQFVYLSLANGKYQMKTTRSIVSSPTTLHATSASLADINGDGCIDVVTTNGGDLTLMLGSCTSQQYTLLEPSHTRNANRLPSLGSGDPPSSVQGVFLIPRSGPTRYDLIVAGQGNQGNPVKWYYNSYGYFGPSATRLGLDNRAYSIAPQFASTRYDYWESNTSGYIYITNAQNFVRLVQISKPDLSSGLDLTPWYYQPSDLSPVNNWPSYIRALSDGNLHAYDGSCDASSRCTKAFPMVITSYKTVWP